MDITAFFLYFAIALFVSFVVLGVTCAVAAWADVDSAQREASAIERERYAEKPR
ncbi:MAG: hypothetical protein AB7P50_20890 [Alphaproteobacteria bacterium]